jgi:hypothetical protein
MYSYVIYVLYFEETHFPDTTLLHSILALILCLKYLYGCITIR